MPESTPPPVPPPLPPEPAEWHFTESGRASGPVTWTQLRERAASGQLYAGDMVWKNGMENWVAADSVTGLFTKPTVAPPPLPLVPVSSAPAPVAALVPNRVTGEFILVGRDGWGLQQPVHLMLDGEEIAVAQWSEGFNHVYFETTVGHHSVKLRQDEVRGRGLFGSNTLRAIAKEQTYPLTFRKPGHYTLNFKIGFEGSDSGFGFLFGGKTELLYPTEIETTYSPQAMDVVPVADLRKKALVGLWQAITGAGLSFIFTHDGAMIRDDGFATKVRWLTKERIELYVDGCAATACYQILSLGTHELILMIDGQSCHFQRGITLTEAATEVQREKAAAEFKKREEEARVKRAEAAANFARVAGGIAAVLATGGFAILCGAAATAGSGGSGVSGGSGERDFREVRCDGCNGKGYRGTHTPERCLSCGGHGVIRLRA